MSSRHRKTSRNPESKNRRVTIRPGLISGPGFKATAYKGADPTFKGRIAVLRGSGMTEFPNVQQLARILREEGISPSAAEQAFGSKKMKKNNGGVGKTVRHGYLKIGGMEAAEYKGPEKKLAGKIHISAPGISAYKTVSEFQHIAQKIGVETEDLVAAFGHMFELEKPEKSDAKLTYGPKRMKLGHVGPRGVSLGTKRGSLILLDSQSGQIVWGVMEEAKTIRNMATNREVSVASVFTKAKSLKIPAQAVYDAFGHMLSAEERRKLVASFHR